MPAAVGLSNSEKTSISRLSSSAFSAQKCCTESIGPMMARSVPGQSSVSPDGATVNLSPVLTATIQPPRPALSMSESVPPASGLSSVTRASNTCPEIPYTSEKY